MSLKEKLKEMPRATALKVMELVAEDQGIDHDKLTYTCSTDSHGCEWWYAYHPLCPNTPWHIMHYNNAINHANKMLTIAEMPLEFLCPYFVRALYCRLSFANMTKSDQIMFAKILQALQTRGNVGLLKNILGGYMGEIHTTYLDKYGLAAVFLPRAKKIYEVTHQ